MRKAFVFILTVLIISSLSAQEIYKNEGLVVNNTITGNWAGVNIPRNVPVKLQFLNNSITSINSSGYLLQAGDESPLLSNNNLNDALISGNKFVWKGTISPSIITHGLFYGYNINGFIRYNYLENVPYGIIFKSGSDAGTNMTFTSGGAAYNIVKNGHFALRVKGINGVKVYNNTFYSGDQAGWYLVLITENMDRTNGSPSLGTRLYNNIFYTKYKIPSIKIDVQETFQDFECDYNIYYCEEGDHKPVFSIGDVEYTWEQWRALGYDAHSYVLNPDFTNTTSFVPRGRLDYGTDLGASWQTGLSTTAVWTPGASPATTDQNGKWQAGAMIYSAVTSPPPVTPPGPVTPPETNTPPVIVVNAPAENLSGFVGEIDASASYDNNNDRLTFTWVSPSGISVSSTNTSKIKFLTPVTASVQTVEFTLKVSDGVSTQTETVPVKIIPYKPDLESAEIIDVKASSFQSPHYPFDAVDGDIGTMWSANGDDQWLLIELKDPFNVQHVKIAFQPGQRKVSYFDVLGSADGLTWETILTKSASCGFSGDLHVFDFPPSKASMDFKYIKYVGHSNSLDSWNYLSEFKIFGYRFRNPGNQDLAVRLYPNPAQEILNIRIDDSTIKPEFIRILNLTGKIIFEERIDPGLRDIQIPVHFRQGIYILQLGSGDLTLFSQKLIISS